MTRVTLRRPLGIVFGERGKGGAVVVEEVASGGNAARSGKVEVGDELVRCSAYVLKSGTDAPREGYGDRPYDNWEQTMFDCRGVDFKTGVVGAGEAGDANLAPCPRQRPCTRVAIAPSSHAVMVALESNNPRWGITQITLELQRGSGAAQETS